MYNVTFKENRILLLEFFNWLSLRENNILDTATPSSLNKRLNKFYFIKQKKSRVSHWLVYTYNHYC